MIHYNVWFSLKAGVIDRDALQKVHEFLGDLKSRRLIHDYQLLRNRAEPGKAKLLPFHTIISFADDDQFNGPFKEVARIGIHAGKHGFMIEHVDDFLVEVFEEL